jgi:hypothetical protein
MNIEKDKIIQYMQNWTFKQSKRGQDQPAEFGKNYIITPTGEIKISAKSNIKNGIFLHLLNKTITRLPYKFAETTTTVSFNITDCRLTTLNGLPRHITGSLYCENTPVRLDGSVETVEKTCLLENCGLESLENLPRNSERYFLKNNVLNSLAGIVSTKPRLQIDVHENKIRNLDGCPQHITTLKLAPQREHILSLDGIPAGLNYIMIDTTTPLLSLLDTDAYKADHIHFIEIDHPENYPDVKHKETAEKLLTLLQNYKNDSATDPMLFATILIRNGFKKLARF